MFFFMVSCRLSDFGLLGGHGRELGLGLCVLFDVGLDFFLPLLAVVAVLLGDAILEGVVGLGLDEQVADGVEHGAELG